MNYLLECPICDITTEVTVRYEEDKPQHCPMCGSDADPIVEDEDED